VTHDHPASAAPKFGPVGPTIFIECTHTFHTDMNTGIQRVVRNVLRHAEAVAAQHGYAVVPVMLEDERFVAVDMHTVLRDKRRDRSETLPAGLAAAPAPLGLRRRIFDALHPAWHVVLRILAALLPFAVARRFIYAPPQIAGLARCILMPWIALRGRPAPVTLDQRPCSVGDVLLLLDSSWTFPIWPAVRRFQARGGRVAGVIYDIIPISHPWTAMPELVVAFEAWLGDHAITSDILIGISRSVAQQLESHLRPCGGQPLTRARIDHFHLGAQLDFVVHTDLVRQGIADIFFADRHIFLMVGSIEPRKKHAFALDAFDAFWASGGDASLVIVGRSAWKTEDVLHRISAHPEFGRRLFLLNDADDSELDFAYRGASALVIASEIEGFGLPIVEAFQRGLPVLCSDIPVFREIADGRATFFALDDPQNLTRAVAEFCRSRHVARREERFPQPWLTWRESTEQLFAAMLG